MAYYVPLLKWKRGERTALQKLSDDIKDQLKPLFNVMPNSDPDTFFNKVQRVWDVPSLYEGKN